MLLRKEKLMLMKHFFCILLLVTGANVEADLIKATFEFTGSKPKAAAIYVINDGAAKIVEQLDQEDKQFTKKVVFSSPGSKVNFHNSDTVDHNIFARDTGTQVQFDIGLMAPGADTSVDVSWSEDSLVRVGCKIHPKMKAYIANVKSDHYIAINPREQVGEIELKGVPAALQDIKVLLPKYDPVKVSLNKGESKTLSLTKKGKTKGTITLSRS